MDRVEAERFYRELKEGRRVAKQLVENNRFNAIRHQRLAYLCGMTMNAYRSQVWSLKECRNKAKEIALKRRVTINLWSQVKSSQLICEVKLKASVSEDHPLQKTIHLLF